MINEVIFRVGPITKLAFCLDAEGNLLRLSAEGSPDTLIPYAVGIESSASDLMHPKPWTIRVEQIIQRLRFLPSTLTDGSDAEAVIKTGLLPEANYPFVPASEFSDSDEQVEAAIQTWDSLADDHPMKAKIEAAMVASGVRRIPRLPRYVEGVHIKTKPSDEFEVVSDGWMSCKKIYRKSVVRGG